MLAIVALVMLAAVGSGNRVISAFQSSAPAQGKGNLIVYGDMAIFLGPGPVENCTLRNRYKRGDPVGFRMFVADPSTGLREESAQLVVHLNYKGGVVDIPMRYRATERQPERQFWVAKWMVPNDAPVGIIRYTVTATDKYGRTGTYKPFEVEASQLTIIE
jgi:hypothetical protein